MRLLHSETLHLTTFYGAALSSKKYAILSHTWLPDHDNGETREVLFQDFENIERLIKEDTRLGVGRVNSREGLFRGLRLISHQGDSNDEMEVDMAESGDRHRRLAMFQRVFTDDHPRLDGLKKVLACCAKARRAGLEYIWIDTCCIDKRSSAELAEAITSMFSWYAKADRCYIHLCDFEPGQPFAHIGRCRWLRRGWTLQELIAAKERIFLDKDWTVIRRTHLTTGEPNQIQEAQDEEEAHIRDRAQIAEDLADITSIQADVLLNKKNLARCGVPQRMQWAIGRETTRPEDKAYCLMGIFNVNLEINYGEGFEEAFRRLQIAFISKYPDHSIFAWTKEPNLDSDRFVGILATSPEDFESTISIGGQIKPVIALHAHRMTNLGLKMKLPIRKNPDGSYTGILNCFNSAWTEDDPRLVGIRLVETQLSRSSTQIFQRVSHNELEYVRPDKTEKPTKIYIEETEFSSLWDDGTESSS